ncbi:MULTISPECIES: hypothetical protein [Bacteria]|uniref:hypothetical protein n=1 Tax=Bacteria TaxID=2 RepID=UPI002E7C4922|nr:hypothetical protein [Cetobacterium somerae]WVJ03047.1 hypothetical protein VSU16_15055 [Cetobacterium somerae]
MVKSKIIKDKYNDLKSWEIIKLSGGYYLKQYICGKQFGRGIRTTKKFIMQILDIKIEFKNGELIIEE